MTEGVRWCLVVPVKRLATAKTRLAGVAGDRRGELALAFALDTVEAVLASSPVVSVVAVTDEPEAARQLAALGATVVPDRPDAGLNPALEHGADVARAENPDAGVGAISADLPALRPDELAVALREGARHAASFVRDTGLDGTTLLLAAPSARLEPRFGPGSAARHAAAGAVELAKRFPTLRRDVDTEEDLVEAARLGLGRRSAALAEALLRGRSH